MPTTVLVVDDDPAFRALTVRMLEALGFVVVGEAGTAAAATSVAAHRRPDAVLVDVGLPDGNGVILARELTALPWSPRVVLTSSNRDAVPAEAARSAGAAGFIPKADLADSALARLLTGRLPQE